MIELFFTAAGFANGLGVGDAEGVGVGVAAATSTAFSCDSFTLICGVEKVKPAAVIFSHPSLSLMMVVATVGVPSELETSIFA